MYSVLHKRTVYNMWKKIRQMIQGAFKKAMAYPPSVPKKTFPRSGRLPSGTESRRVRKYRLTHEWSVPTIERYKQLKNTYATGRISNKNAFNLRNLEMDLMKETGFHANNKHGFGRSRIYTFSTPSRGNELYKPIWVPKGSCSSMYSLMISMGCDARLVLESERMPCIQNHLRHMIKSKSSNLPNSMVLWDCDLWSRIDPIVYIKNSLYVQGVLKKTFSIIVGIRFRENAFVNFYTSTPFGYIFSGSFDSQQLYLYSDEFIESQRRQHLQNGGGSSSMNIQTYLHKKSVKYDRSQDRQLFTSEWNAGNVLTFAFAPKGIYVIVPKSFPIS